MAGEHYTSPKGPDLPLNQPGPNALGEYPEETVARIVSGAAGELPKSKPPDAVVKAVASAVRQTLQQHHNGEIPTKND